MSHIVLLRMKILIPKAVLINYVVNVEFLITLLCELSHSTKTVQTVANVSN